MSILCQYDGVRRNEDVHKELMLTDFTSMSIGFVYVLIGFSDMLIESDH